MVHGGHHRVLRAYPSRLGERMGTSIANTTPEVRRPSLQLSYKVNSALDGRGFGAATSAPSEATPLFVESATSWTTITSSASGPAPSSTTTEATAITGVYTSLSERVNVLRSLFTPDSTAVDHLIAALLIEPVPEVAANVIEKR